MISRPCAVAAQRARPSRVAAAVWRNCRMVNCGAGSKRTASPAGRIAPRAGIAQRRRRTRRTNGTLTPVAVNDPIHLDVEVRAPLLVVLAQRALVLHAELLHDASRGRVAREVLREDAVEAQALERPPQHAARRLGHVAAPPVR